MNIKLIQNKLDIFANERNWSQFHSPKNLSMALEVEVPELLGIFHGLTDVQSKSLIKNDKEMLLVKEEIADVFIYLVRLADKMDIDIEKVVLDKMVLNEQKYPIELANNNATKYNRR